MNHKTKPTQTFDEDERADGMLQGLERGNIYTVSRRLKGERVFRQCSYYGFDLGKHVFKTVDDDDGEVPNYPPKGYLCGS